MIDKPKHKIAKTDKEAWAIQERYEGLPGGWIQWKGTSVCMDVHCICGTGWHVDAGFAYYVKCPYCGRVYMCNGHIEFIEIEDHEGLSAIVEHTSDEVTYLPDEED
jgi:hypothetical protein